MSDQSIKVQLSGVKTLKNPPCYRLEFDVPEIEGEKVATLLTQVNNCFDLVLVKTEEPFGDNY